MGQRKNYFLQLKTFYAYQKGQAEHPYFTDEACFSHYLNRLLHCLKAFRQQLHTYLLLPSEVHLLVSPYSSRGLVHVMDKVAADYGAYFHNRFSGNCSLLADKPVLHQLGSNCEVLNCQKSIELIPVQEQLVSMPGEYPWSGYRINAFGGHRDPVVMHHQYRNFCRAHERPFQRYRDFVTVTSSAGDFRPGLEDYAGYNESASMS